MTIRGLLLSRLLPVGLVTLLAISVAGCAEEPEQEPSDSTEQVVSGVAELDIRGSGANSGEAANSGDAADSRDDGDTHHDQSLPRETNKDLGSPDDSVLSSDAGPGGEPDPVPWRTPRYLAANDG